MPRSPMAERSARGRTLVESRSAMTRASPRPSGGDPPSTTACGASSAGSADPRGDDPPSTPRRGASSASSADPRGDDPPSTTACGASSASSVIDVAAVDDHPIVLAGVAAWGMAAQSGIRVVAAAATVDVVLAGPGRHAHVVLLDLDLPERPTPH